MAVECRIDGNFLSNYFKSGNFTSQSEVVGLNCELARSRLNRTPRRALAMTMNLGISLGLKIHDIILTSPCTNSTNTPQYNV